MNKLTCPACKTEYVPADRSKLYQLISGNGPRSQRWEGNSASDLTQTWPRQQRLELPDWATGKVWERALQTAISCLVAGGCSYTISLDNPPIETVGLVAGFVWFGSMLLGDGNWRIVFNWLDRNRDGRLTIADVHAAIDEALGHDEDEPPGPLPEIPVEVIIGQVTRRGILNATQEQMEQAAHIMDANPESAFSKRVVGHVFGEGLFSKVQAEMLKTGLLGGSRHTGYKLTREGWALMKRYLPHPTGSGDSENGGFHHSPPATTTQGVK